MAYLYLFYTGPRFYYVITTLSEKGVERGGRDERSRDWESVVWIWWW